MRSNPFAPTFGRKTEERRDDLRGDPPGGQSRFTRLPGLTASIARRERAPAVASAPPSHEAAPVDDAPAADSLATLRSWGRPQPEAGDPVDAPEPPQDAPGSSDPAAIDAAGDADVAAADWHPAPPETEAAAAAPADFEAAAPLDRLRQELGVDAERDAAWQPGEGAEPPPDRAAEQPAAPARQSGEASDRPAAAAFARRIAPPAAASQAAAAAPDLDEDQDEDGSLDDVAVTIGRVVSIRGAVIWGALFDDADGTTARAARMGALVSMRGPDSRLFGVVNSLQREAHGGNQAERTVFEIQVLGEIANAVPESAAGFQRGVSSYPPLDAPVTTVTLRDLAKVYARPRMSNVHVGRLRHNRKVPAFVLTDSLLGKHFAVLGTTGAGKSCAVTVILRSILDEHPHGHVILLDPHNEYASAFADKAELLNPSNLQLPYWLLNFEEISHVLIGAQSGEQAYAQSLILKDAILHAKKLFAGAGAEDSTLTVDTPVPYRLSDLTAALKEGMGMLNKSERSTSPYLSLIARTESLRIDKRYAFMFSSIAVRDTMRQVLAQLLRIPVEGKPITIIDISGVPSEIVDVVVSVLFRLMFELAIWSERGAAPPMLLVCEEAHRYVPQEDGAGFAPTKRVISRIAKEGRKYGITLCLVSQRPSELSITSLSQCNTVFALRLSNEHDQAFVARALSENARWLVDSLPSLNTQEAVVVGDGVTVPVHIRFKDLKREHRPSGFDRSFSAAWRSEADPNFLDRTIDRWRRQAR
ncbi:MAG TPA: DUF87 domain-containing protein [Geminicoccaceae bacterium]|nr:DUF87 domain-containing protein [Geminicoccaceae bacterium]